jgi:hypothetical protein
VTEAYAQEVDDWKMVALAFTKLLPRTTSRLLSRRTEPAKDHVSMRPLLVRSGQSRSELSCPGGEELQSVRGR